LAENWLLRPPDASQSFFRRRQAWSGPERASRQTKTSRNPYGNRRSPTGAQVVGREASTNIGPPLRVLLFDEPGDFDAVVSALSHGYEVVTTTRATEALELLRRDAFGVVLADLDLRRDHDRLLLAELRLRWPQTVGIVFTTYESLDNAADALSDGAWDYVVKPCPPSVLTATIARAMERGALARALREGLQELDDANARLQALSDDLQRRVDESTAELRRKLTELDAANRKLREAQEQREELIAMIAHDLGGPLTTVSGYLQLISRPSSTPAQRERARRSLGPEMERLSRLVADLADASRLATGRFRIASDECDLAALVREQVELARAQTPGRAIRRSVPRRPVPVVCDRHRIAQVLWNLISNALKYAPTGPIRVGLRPTRGGASITVDDRGPGVPAELLETIFEPHVRLSEGEPGGAPKGHGLGLHIARGIVEAHGGRIWARRRAGDGASFHVWLPGRPASSRPSVDRPLDDAGV
jgi:signal transduction histidine kinase